MHDLVKISVTISRRPTLISNIWSHIWQDCDALRVDQRAIFRCRYNIVLGDTTVLGHILYFGDYLKDTPEQRSGISKTLA